MLVPRAVVLVRCGGRAIASYRLRLPRDSRRLVRRVAVAMTVPSSAVPVDGDGDGDVGVDVDVVGGGVGCGMWYVVGGNSRQGKSLESVTDEGVLCLVGLCFLPRSSLHHTHTHLRTHNTFTRRRRRHPTRVRDRRAVSISGRVFDNRAINRPAALKIDIITASYSSRLRQPGEKGRRQWVGRPSANSSRGRLSQSAWRGCTQMSTSRCRAHTGTTTA